jgi:hypothetical protein
MARLSSLVSLISNLATPIFNAVHQNLRFTNGFFQICTLPGHHCQCKSFLSTRHMQKLTSCQLNAIPDIHTNTDPANINSRVWKKDIKSLKN